jgi:hypothetical protein
MKTIGQLKTTITPRLHGTTLNKIGDFYTLCRDTAENMLSRIDPAETNRRTLLPNAVYDRVYDYSLPTDFKAPSDLKKQTAQFTFSDNSSLARTYSRQFGNQKADNQFAIIWENAVQFMRFAKYINIPALIDPADSLTANGAWSVGGNASDLVVDTLNHVAGSGSLKATVSNPGAVVNVILRIGNNDSNYFTKTITAGHFEAFVTGWNLCRFDLSDAVETGTVDTENIDYIRVTVTYNTAQTAYFEKTLTLPVDLSVNSGDYFSNGAIFMYLDFGTVLSLTTLRLDNITANIGTLYDISYYSNYLFRTSAGSWIVEPTVDTDILNLSGVSYKIFEAEMCKIITQQMQGAMGAFDFAYWNLQLEGDDNTLGLYDQYLMQFPSERIEGQTDYYNVSDDFPGDQGSINGQPASYNN